MDHLVLLLHGPSRRHVAVGLLPEQRVILACSMLLTVAICMACSETINGQCRARTRKGGSALRLATKQGRLSPRRNDGCRQAQETRMPSNTLRHAPTHSGSDAHHMSHAENLTYEVAYVFYIV